MTTISTSTLINQSFVNNSLWPITISGGSSSNIITITFSKNITLSNFSNYFIISSDYVQIGSSSLNSDGTIPNITVNVTNYNGLIQNGLSGVQGYDNVYVYNLNIDGTGGSQQIGAGWIGQNYFGGSSNNYIINCSSLGTIAGGGILGDNAQNVYIIGCSSSGNITEANVGGIVGQYVNSVTLQSCWSTGNIAKSGTGGIVGGYSKKVTVTDCYSTGEISGDNAGGIIGSNSGSTSTSIKKCYSTGAITGANSGGICGSLAPGNNEEYKVTITNCYSSGHLNNSVSSYNGGICGILLPTGSGTIDLSIQNCYTCGTLNYASGYIIGNDTTVNGTSSSPTQYTLTYNYSEAYSGTPGSWNDSNANNTLTGTPSGGYPSTWITTGTNVAYLLFNMGYTPYSTTNVSGTSLITTSSSTVTAGNSTSSAIIVSGPSYTFLEDYSSYSITINYGSGIISTTSSTPAGTYTLYIYDTINAYGVSIYTLTVNSVPEPPTPIPIQNNGTYLSTNQSVSFNQKSSFCGTRAVSSTTVGIGAIRGKGSATRIFNNCKNNSVNFKLCQFRVLGYK